MRFRRRPACCRSRVGQELVSCPGPAHGLAVAGTALALSLMLLMLGCGQPEPAAGTAGPPAEAAAPTPFDHSLFDTILLAHVENGLVDYEALKGQHSKQLEQYLRSLADAKGFAGRDEELAFWLNAYNAFVIKGVLEHYPGLESVMEVKGFFDDRRWRAARKLHSLNEIENEIIRPKFKDPRIHFILACAAQSCPPLQSRAMNPASLQSQLESAARNAINSTKYVRVDPKAKVLRLTRVMSWYRKDFEENAGSLQAYVLKSIEDPAQSQLQRADYTVQFMDYDWALNDASTR